LSKTLVQQLQEEFWRSVLIRNLMMGDAKATYYQGWKAKMEDLK